MILVSNKDFYDDVFMTQQKNDVVIIPTPSFCSNFKLEIKDKATKECYHMVPESLTYFIDMFMGGCNTMEDTVEIAKDIQSLTPPTYQCKVMPRNTDLAKFLPYVPGRPMKLSSTPNPQAPTFIMQTVSANFYGTKTEFLHDLGDDKIKTGLFACFKEAALVINRQPNKGTVYVAPLFMEPGLHDKTNTQDSDWANPTSYIDNMIKWLGMYSFWRENNVILYTH